MEYKKGDKIRLNPATVKKYVEYLVSEGMGRMASSITEMVEANVAITVERGSSKTLIWVSESKVVNGSLEVKIKDQKWSSIPSALILPKTLLKRGEK